MPSARGRRRLSAGEGDHVKAPPAALDEGARTMATNNVLAAPGTITVH